MTCGRDECLRCAGSGWHLGDECTACAGAGSRPAAPAGPRRRRVADLAATEHAGDAMFWPVRRAGARRPEALARQLAQLFASHVPSSGELARFAGIGAREAEGVLRTYAASLRATARQLRAADPYRDDDRGERTRRRAAALETEARRVELTVRAEAAEVAS